MSETSSTGGQWKMQPWIFYVGFLFSSCLASLSSIYFEQYSHYPASVYPDHLSLASVGGWRL